MGVYRVPLQAFSEWEYEKFIGFGVSTEGHKGFTRFSLGFCVWLQGVYRVYGLEESGFPYSASVYSNFFCWYVGGILRDTHTGKWKPRLVMEPLWIPIWSKQNGPYGERCWRLRGASVGLGRCPAMRTKHVARSISNVHPYSRFLDVHRISKG